MNLKVDAGAHVIDNRLGPDAKAPTRRTPRMPHRIEVTGTRAADLSASLDHAVALAQVAAIQRGSLGVLVRRHDYDRFTVEVSPEVPYGMTMERDDLDRPVFAEG